MSIQADRPLETFAGTVEVLTLDAAGNVTATRPGTLRARRVALREPAR